MKRTKILATYGPATSRAADLKRLIKSGVNAFRINCSHGATPDFLAAARNIRSAAKDSQWPVGLLFDISGPKLRVDRFDGKLHVSRGQDIVFHYGKTSLAEGKIGVNHKEIIGQAKKGQPLLIDDGKIFFDVIRADSRQIVAKAKNPGTIFPGKGINLPGMRLPIPTLGKKDREDIKTAVRVDADYIALSFVRSVGDIAEARKLVKKLGGRQMIIAKLEKREAVEILDQLIEQADGVMVARGDLGVELPPAEVPLLQKKITHLANLYHKPVIVATQMLESMRTAPRATRAEINDIATAVFDYVDCIMLSAETATGKYPIQAVQTMTDVARTTEADLPPAAIDLSRHVSTSQIPMAVGEAVAAAIRIADVKAILAFTTSGFTAELISNLFPAQIVVALTPDRKVMTRLSIYRSVYPVQAEQPASFEDMVTTVNDTARKYRLARKGQKIIVTGGVPFGSTAYTNFMMVHKVS
ncbi:MAG: pyruvate kinase [Candidatus Zixiibacteriota bacterium]